MRLVLLTALLPIILMSACGELNEDDSSTDEQGQDGIGKTILKNTSEPPTLGSICADGCVWSNFAVIMGAQSATHSCFGGACACVQFGNIHSTCQPYGDSDSSENSLEEPQSEASIGGINSGSSTSAIAGNTCASGCVWSTFAVQMGAQSGGADCGGQSCACVQQGNIWASCGTSAGSSPQVAAPTQPQANPQPQAQPQTGNTHAYGGAYNSAMGNRLANIALGIAIRRNTVGDCYNAAADAIESVVPRFLYGMSAYMAADQLAAHPRFAEISTGNLRGLPAGAVVVWGKGTSRHGHISIALGDGREASDHVANQMTYHYGGAPARVFLPN